MFYYPTEHETITVILAITSLICMQRRKACDFLMKFDVIGHCIVKTIPTCFPITFTWVTSQAWYCIQLFHACLVNSQNYAASGNSALSCPRHLVA